jgi:hypothetical protein
MAKNREQRKNSLNKKLERILEINTCSENLKDTVFLCTICDSVIFINPKQGVKQLEHHLISKKHRNLTSLEADKSSDEDRRSSFHKDLLQFFIGNNFPFNKLNSEATIFFTEKHCVKKPLGRKTYVDNILPLIYDHKYEQKKIDLLL